MRLALSVLLMGAAMSACSSSVDLNPTVVGKWDQANEPPGNSVEMTLATSGSSISGAGTWCGEALRCGVISVSGMVNGDAIQLDIVYDSGLIEHFDGRINLLGIIDGSEIGSIPGEPPQPPHAVTFRRA